MSDHDIFRFLRKAVADNPVALAYVETAAEEIAERRAALAKHTYGHDSWGLAGLLDDRRALARAERDAFHQVATTLLAMPSAPEKTGTTTPEDTVDELYSLLVELAEHTPCQLDHHDICIEHSWMDPGPCPHGRAQELLKERSC